MAGQMSERADRFVDKLLGQRLNLQPGVEKKELSASSENMIRLLNRRRREALARRRGL